MEMRAAAGSQAIATSSVDVVVVVAVCLAPSHVYLSVYLSIHLWLVDSTSGLAS